MAIDPVKVKAADFINDGGTIKAINGTTSTVDSSSTSAATVIQYAIDNLPTTGGRIHMKSGTYTITSTITVNKAGIGIQGEGDGTLLQCNGSAVSPMFAMADTTKRSFNNFENFRMQSTSLGNGLAFNTSYFTRSVFQALE
ncbi:hypothetical protein Ngar_c30460 [Candidatus Nitrososphaera gargensis Ga9.2]|uniref:Pectate lyase superfamily protein domain-containing protein n=1 Tax=Nitrososphaera gargensis (strain Ga9.2) TaxID=1237085 RepID=K0IM36_NITGG|nr:hypothetical protein [Candidatus Nitrososphaera gargensis]AFU59962.1 hypothetical protein Ngar_c30460 [Candidatus Nitrososphaera gargensis Ga9.2]